MRFFNATPFPAFLHREAIDGDRIAAAVIMRVTYDLGEPSSPSREQPWRVSPTPWESPAGLAEGDGSFDRHGCDLILLGEAQSPDGRPVTTIEVAVGVQYRSQAPPFFASVRVVGDRTWQRINGVLRPSAPLPFDRMPLDLAHAFGGIAVFDELAVPFGDNPRGKGFYLEEELAEGGALPNIESPGQLIDGWTDRPDPAGVGFCPVPFGPRVRRATVIREGQVVGVKHAIFNVAFPSFVCPTPEPGSTLTVRGMGPELQLRLPEQQFVAVTRVGATEHCDPLRIDQVGLEVGLGRFFMTYRYTFIYPCRPGDERRCELQWRRGGSLPEHPAKSAEALADVRV